MRSNSDGETASHHYFHGSSSYRQSRFLSWSWSMKDNDGIPWLLPELVVEHILGFTNLVIVTGGGRTRTCVAVLRGGSTCVCVVGGMRTEGDVSNGEPSCIWVDDFFVTWTFFGVACVFDGCLSVTVTGGALWKRILIVFFNCCVKSQRIADLLGSVGTSMSSPSSLSSRAIFLAKPFLVRSPTHE